MVCQVAMVTHLTLKLSNSYINHKGYPLKTEVSMHFYGFDSQDRHLKAPGYGVWSSDETEFFNDVN